MKMLARELTRLGKKSPHLNTGGTYKNAILKRVPM
jgi:hypothetical protein